MAKKKSASSSAKKTKFPVSAKKAVRQSPGGKIKRASGK